MSQAQELPSYNVVVSDEYWGGDVANQPWQLAAACFQRRIRHPRPARVIADMVRARYQKLIGGCKIDRLEEGELFPADIGTNALLRVVRDHRLATLGSEAAYRALHTDDSDIDGPFYEELRQQFDERAAALETDVFDTGSHIAFHSSDRALVFLRDVSFMAKNLPQDMTAGIESHQVHHPVADAWSNTGIHVMPQLAVGGTYISLSVLGRVDCRTRVVSAHMMSLPE